MTALHVWFIIFTRHQILFCSMVLHSATSATWTSWRSHGGGSGAYTWCFNWSQRCCMRFRSDDIPYDTTNLLEVHDESTMWGCGLIDGHVVWGYCCCMLQPTCCLARCRSAWRCLAFKGVTCNGRLPFNNSGVACSGWSDQTHWFLWQSSHVSVVVLKWLRYEAFFTLSRCYDVERPVC